MKIFFEKIYYTSLEELLKRTLAIQGYLQMISKIKNKEHANNFLYEIMRETSDINFLCDKLSDEIIRLANGKKI